MPTTNNNANSYVYGQCTWYVAATLSWIPAGLGDAANWYSNYKARGGPVGPVPEVGSVACWNKNLPGSDQHGHVAIVTDVLPVGFNVKEMNYTYGPGQVDTRYVSSTTDLIGFLYPPGTNTSLLGLFWQNISSLPGGLSSVFTGGTPPPAPPPVDTGVFNWDWNINIGPINYQESWNLDGLVGGLAILGGGLIWSVGILVLVASFAFQSGIPQAAVSGGIRGGPVGAAASATTTALSKASRPRRRRRSRDRR